MDNEMEEFNEDFVPRSYAARENIVSYFWGVLLLIEIVLKVSEVGKDGFSTTF